MTMKRVSVRLPGYRYTRVGPVGICTVLWMLHIRWVDSVLQIKLG